METVQNTYDVVDFVEGLRKEFQRRGELDFVQDLDSEISRALTASDLIRTYGTVLERWKSKIESPKLDVWNRAIEVCSVALRLGDPRFRTTVP